MSNKKQQVIEALTNTLEYVKTLDNPSIFIGVGGGKTYRSSLFGDKDFLLTCAVDIMMTVKKSWKALNRAGMIDAMTKVVYDAVDHDIEIMEITGKHLRSIFKGLYEIFET